MTQAPEVPAVDLGDGVAMPMVGFGTWQLRGRKAHEAIRYALEVGYRHLDTATMYRNEAEVGSAVRDSGLDRDAVFITTKLHPNDAGRERVALDASLGALGTDYVDLWLIHWPPRGRSGIGAWQELLAAKSEGRARAVGVSNYSPAQIDELIKATGKGPAVNQIPWSPSDHNPELLAAIRARGVVVEGYSPLKGTRLRNSVLAEIAARHGVTPAQVVLRWHLEHGIPIIPKSSEPGRIKSNFDLGFTLTPDEIAAIDAL